MKNYLLCTLFSVICYSVTIGQGIELQPCGTKDPTIQQIDEMIRFNENWISKRNTGTNCLAIKAHVFRNNDGSEGISNEDLAIGLSYLNAFYYDAGLEFYYCGSPDYINNTDLYNYNEDSPDNDSETDIRSAINMSNEAINILFVKNITLSGGFGACGYAYFPHSDNYYNFIMMNEGCTAAAPNGTYVHEVGHYFNLYHTHQGTNQGPMSTYAENVARTGGQANCTTAGDLLCDTHADPQYNPAEFNYYTCTYTGTGQDQYGQYYTPPIDNVMSYYPDHCGGIFTPQQYIRIQQGYDMRDGYPAYSFDCTPPVVNAPSSLNAVVDNSVTLTWTDNATNEIGYLVERSAVGPTAGFKAIIGAGVQENITSYSDYDIEANTHYWYRVKPINGDCNNYSPVVDVMTGLIYCEAGSQTCDEYIARVQVGTIDHMSSCSPGGYENYTSIMTTMNSGDFYPITVTNGNPIFAMDYCGIWIDWNADGDFDDAGELIPMVDSIGPGPYTATITPPNFASAGHKVMRIRITYNQAPQSCGIDTYGEVEDYTIVLQNNCGSNFRYWTGMSSSDSWNETDNWDCAIPSSADQIVLPENSPPSRVYNGMTAHGHTLDVRLGASLTVEKGAIMTIE